MNSQEIRQKFLTFFKERNHTIVPSSSLISDDSSVLFTTAGMQQFKPYYTGELDPETTIHPNLGKPVGKNAVSIQKCFRTSDINSVGDESHLTFFEMLGNFSFGGYFKKEAIEYAYEFITKKLGLKIDYVSIFEGDNENNIPPDEESEKIWKKIDSDIEIKKSGMKDNFWGPTGEEGPCGPTTEIYINGIEIWNIVFNEYFKDKNEKFIKLETPGVDTGMGLERLAMIMQNKPTIFETDILDKIIKTIEEESGASYNRADDESKRMFRIIADHIRAAVFLVAEGICPGKNDRDYIVRRLLRRATLFANILQILPASTFSKIIAVITEEHKNQYPELEKSKNNIEEIIYKEEQEFEKTIARGMREFEKLPNKNGVISGIDAFVLATTYGFPIELTQEIAKKHYGATVDMDAFEKEFKKHQEISRAGLEKKFGGHGLKGSGEITGATEEEKQRIVKLHTATHLLHQALFDVLGGQIKQMGSDINTKRLRFDFPFERKLTAEEIAELEAIVNQKIKEDLPVEFKEKTKEEAIAEGAKAFFKVKYPDKVKVYYIGDPSASSGQAYSKEICNGPHVKNTSEIGRFKILKEESVGAGIRRIKATIEI